LRCRAPPESVMPEYPYRCAVGHETDRFYHAREAANRPQTVRCRCGRRARRMIVAPAAVGLVTEHYNSSLGEIVKGPRHLRALQKKHGCHDYVPPTSGPISEFRRKHARLIR